MSLVALEQPLCTLRKVWYAAFEAHQLLGRVINGDSKVAYKQICSQEVDSYHALDIIN